MGSHTKIEWTDATWNPILGCSRVSEGCRNCYAERIAGRFPHESVYAGLTQIVNGRAVWTGQIKETKKLLEPLSWRKPRRVFVNSMSDLFHENVSDELRDRIFAVMALCPQHTFQVLTKRPERMLAYLDPACGRIADRVIAMRRERGDNGVVCPLPHLPPGSIWWPLANVWLGVSAENQATADERIPLLLQTPAAVRFLSAEPLLGPMNLRALNEELEGYEDALCGLTVCDGRGTKETPKLDWVICGGESGPGARPMHPGWARGLREQCAFAGVPFFFKQWGEWEPSFHSDTQFADVSPKTACCRLAADGHIGYSQAEMEGHPRHGLMVRAGKKHAGAKLDGYVWAQFPRGDDGRVR